MSRTVAIVQARMGSTRLPGKVLLPLVDGIAAIDLLLARLSQSQELDEIVVATSDLVRDDALAAHLDAAGQPVFRGSEEDTLSRYAGAAAAYDADTVVRITGDCPLVDPLVVDMAIRGFCSAGVDYYSNVDPPTFPDGIDVEVFSRAALVMADEQAKSPEQREHVTVYLREIGAFSRASFCHSEDLSGLRLTLDEQADLDTLRTIFAHFAPRTDMSWKEVARYMTTDGKNGLKNQTIARNEGAQIGTGQKLWKRAKKVIPGGNMLLSKRAEMFLPDQWPAYFSRTEGCAVWDMDGNKFLDLGLMGVGTNSLGYSHAEVDAAVADVVAKGNLSTLNAPEEVYLAERLVDLHPWSDMVRFARSGGEANAISIRIGRAASGRDGVAMCGYHGWHDWYLAANLGDNENLDGHLLPGLEPRGVPRDLKGSVHPFMYNDFDALARIVDTQEIGVIKMEVMRNVEPADGFLHKVRELATQKDIVLIFDECTSGFRETFGGLHLKYGVEPDLATFGKTLGNGYAVTAVLGREAVMQAAQSTFISSTFWTERIGSAAALKTLEVMERERSWEQITATGQKVIAGWTSLAEAHGVGISISGLPSIAAFVFASERGLEYGTYLIQRMLEQGYLATTALYASLAHSDAVLDRYFQALDPVFETLAGFEKGTEDIHNLLAGPVRHGGFKRLN
ncbi:MAG: aminotransferase class III-fold pyridoxal phosphate-dependent enzyme [Tateyamaria sp.]|uniref:aminotransferase class III-fold pyridoxal phosphate-dependent enzyme n=1 Tax=Tateyamaria sp. TaxID=1929288 RepID=UPI00327EE658